MLHFRLFEFYFNVFQTKVFSVVFFFCLFCFFTIGICPFNCCLLSLFVAWLAALGAKWVEGCFTNKLVFGYSKEKVTFFASHHSGNTFAARKLCPQPILLLCFFTFCYTLPISFSPSSLPLSIYCRQHFRFCLQFRQFVRIFFLFVFVEFFRLLQSRCAHSTLIIFGIFALLLILWDKFSTKRNVIAT